MGSGDPFRVEHLRRDLEERSVRGGVLMVVAQVGKLVLRLASTAVLARLLVPADFGLVAMLTVATGFAGLFAGMGLATATVQREDFGHAEASALFWLVSGLGVGLAIVTVLLAPAIAWFYGEPRLVAPAVVLSATFVTGGVGVQQRALLRRQMRFRALVVVEVVSMLAGIGVAIAMALRGAGYWALVAMIATTSAVDTLLLWMLSGWRPGLRIRGVGARAALGLGGRVSGFNALNYAGRNLDRLLLGWQWGPDVLGFYSRAQVLMTLPLQQVNAPLSGVFVSTLSRLRDEPARYRATYLGIVEALTLLTTPLLALGIGAADWIVDLVLGPQWSRAAVLFAILGVAALSKPVANTTGWLFISQGRGDHLWRWGLVSSSLHAAAVVGGLPWGAVGVAVALALRSVVAFPLLVWFVGREGPVSSRDIAATLALPTLVLAGCAVPLAALRLGLPGLGTFPGLPLAVAGVAVATGLVLALAPPGRRALRELRHAVALATRRPAAVRERAAQPAAR